MQQKKNGLRCAQILWKYWLNVVWCIDLIQNSNYTKELQSNRNQWEVNSLIFVCGGKLSRALYDFVCCWCFVSVSVCVCVCVLICACVWRFKFDTQSANLLLFLLIFFFVDCSSCCCPTVRYYYLVIELYFVEVVARSLRNEPMKMSGQVRLEENGVLDEELPTLLECAFKYLSKNLKLMYQQNELNQIENIILPNEICDRWVLSLHISFSTALSIINIIEIGVWCMLTSLIAHTWPTSVQCARCTGTILLFTSIWCVCVNELYACVHTTCG